MLKNADLLARLDQSIARTGDGITALQALVDGHNNKENGKAENGS